MDSISPSRRGWVAGLRRFASAPEPQHHCELCGTAIEHLHPHLVEPGARKLVCSCRPCALLFGNQPAGHYRAVHRHAEWLTDFAISDTQWNALQIPINMAFFVSSGSDRRLVALYPSPGGATESLPDAEQWRSVEDDNPVLASFEPDVEALLVNRTGGARDCYRVSIDYCYELVGLIRSHWRGVSGGSDVHQAIDEFFAALKQSAGRAEALH